MNSYTFTTPRSKRTTNMSQQNIMFSPSSMNPNVYCPPMEPSYSHRSEDSISSFGFPDPYVSSPAQDLVDIPSTQSPFDPCFDTLDPIYDFPQPTQFDIPDIYTCSQPNTNTTYPVPISTMQYPQYYDSPPLLSTSGSTSSCASSSPPIAPMQWTAATRDEPLLGFSNKSNTKSFICTDCDNGKAFTRSADLKRHQASVHYPVFQDCCVPECSRKGLNGFPRRDHLVEHLRSYHHMHVPKRRGSRRVAKA